MMVKLQHNWKCWCVILWKYICIIIVLIYSEAQLKVLLWMVESIENFKIFQTIFVVEAEDLVGTNMNWSVLRT